MATTIGTAYVQILPSTKGIKSAMEEGLSDISGPAGSSLGADLGEATGKGFGSSIGGAVKSGLSLAAGALTATTGVMTAFSATAVNTGMSFDSAMSQVYATMGKTSEEALSSTETVELAWGTFNGNLREYAQEIGANTMFSASQAAEGLNYMALAGYSARESMEMLPTVMNLAAAGGIDLGAASDMVTDAQSALGLSFEETTIMVDQMAKASSTTNTSVEQLGDAILTVGGTARNLSGGTAELAQVLGILADNGIKAGEGGTHLRNIMMSMIPKSEAAAEAFESLGLNTYDANGALRPMEDIFLDLSAALDGMTNEEREKTLSAIFNKTDIAAVNALLNTSAERWDEVGTAISEAEGSAGEMANIQMDNLSGDLQLWQSAVEAAQIAVSDRLTPSLRDFVQLGTEGVSSITSAFQSGGLEGAMGALGEWLSKAIAKVTEMLPTLVQAGSKLLSALIQGLADNIPQLTSAAVQIGTTLVTAIMDNAPALLGAAMTAIGTFASGIGEALPTLMPQAVQAVFTIGSTIVENAPSMLEGAMALIRGLGEGLLASLPIILEQLPGFILSMVDTLRTELPQVLAFATEMIGSLSQGLMDALPTLLESVPEIIANISGAFVEMFPQIVETGIQLFTSLVENLPQIIETLVEAIPEIVLALVDAIGDALPEIIDAGYTLLTALITNLPQIIVEILGGVAEIVKEIVKGLLDRKDEIIDAGYNLLLGLKDGIANAVGAVIDKVKDVAGNILDSIKGFFGIASPSRVLRAIGRNLGESLGMGLDDNADLPVRAMRSLSESVEDAFRPSLEYGDVSTPSIYNGAVLSRGTMESSRGGHAGGNGYPQYINIDLVIDKQRAMRWIYSLNQERAQQIGLNFAGGI